MAKPGRNRTNLVIVIVGFILAVGCGMALTGSALTPTKSLVFTAFLAALTGAFYRSIAVVLGVVVTALVLCFLVAPHIPV